MAIDTTPSQVATSALQAIPFGSIIGGPLKAAIEAQAMAAQTSWQFIQEVGLTVNPQTNQKEAVNVSFQFMQDGRMVQLNVPLLTIVPIPYIAIQNVDINFKANISASSSSVQENSSSQSVDASLGIKAKAGWGPFSVEANMKANYSSKKDSKATQDSRYSVEYTMDVAVKAGQDSMPAGLAKVLELLGNAMDVSNPKGTLEVNARTLTLDSNGNATLIVTYKNSNGLFESDKIKVSDVSGTPCNAIEINTENAVFELKSTGNYTVEVTDNADKKLTVKVEQ